MVRATGQTSADRGREIRKTLLATAAGLIGELGWNAVSTRNLADRAGVRPGLIHYHFPTLQALLRAAAIEAIRQVVAETVPLLTQARSLEDGIDALLGAVDGYTGHDPASLLFSEAYLTATRDTDLRMVLADLIADFRRELADWLAGHGQESPEETATALIAILDGLVLHKALNPQLSAMAVRPVLHRLLLR